MGPRNLAGATSSDFREENAGERMPFLRPSVPQQSPLCPSQWSRISRLFSCIFVAQNAKPGTDPTSVPSDYGTFTGGVRCANRRLGNDLLRSLRDQYEC
jgi:hypothetical protein